MTEAIAGPVTEIVYIPLKTGIDLANAGNKAVLEDTLTKLASLAGIKAVYYGFQVENPDTLQMVVDWESLARHTAFQESPDYKPFLDRLATIQSDDKRESLFHVRMPAGGAPGVVDPRTAAVTECISVYFEPGQDQEKWMEENWLPFQKAVLASDGHGIHGIIGGWSIEGHKHEKIEGGLEGKMLAAFIGWPSVEAHMEFRKTKDFEQIIPLLRTGPAGTAVHHVAFKRRA